MLHFNPTMRGFTLIEALITVIIVGILAAIIVPGFQDSVYTARRGVAKSDLLSLAQAEAKWRASNPAYTPNVSDLLGVGAAIASTYYSYAISVNTGSFAITATPSGSQSGDVCGTLQIDQTTTLTSLANNAACPIRPS